MEEKRVSMETIIAVIGMDLACERLTNLAFVTYTPILLLLCLSYMHSFFTSNWRLTRLNKTRINLLHPLYASFEEQLKVYLTPGYDSKKNRDGSVTFAAASFMHAETLVQQLTEFFTAIENNNPDTPLYTYTLSEKRKDALRVLALAFEGCVGIVLQEKLGEHPLLRKEWQFINSKAGGLCLGKLTLFFYTNYAKVIHPITMQNYYLRDVVERTTAQIIKGMAARINEAQPGYEGLAMLSYVEDQTKLSAREIVSIITSKTNSTQNPSYFSLLTP